MTIDIQSPELEAFLTERMQSGEFASIEEALLEALHLDVEAPETQRPTRTILETFAAARGLGEGVDFSRDQSPGRPVDL